MCDFYLKLTATLLLNLYCNATSLASAVKQKYLTPNVHSEAKNIAAVKQKYLTPNVHSEAKILLL